MVSAEAVARMVYPSGSAFATAALPMVPPAPARFSTTIGWPSWLESWSKTSRGTTSTALPAPNGTIALIGLVGQACARATYGKADSAAAPAAICRNRRRGSFIFIMDLPPSIGARGARTCRGHEGVMPTDGMFAARCNDRKLARPGGSLGEMLQQLREQAEGAASRFLLQVLAAAIGTSRTSRDVRLESAKWAKGDIALASNHPQPAPTTRPCAPS